MWQNLKTTNILHSKTSYLRAIICITLISVPLFVLPFSMSIFSVPKMVFLAWVSGVLALLKFAFPGNMNNSGVVSSTRRVEVIVIAGAVIATIYIPFSSNPYLSLLMVSCIISAGLMMLFMAEVSPAVLMSAASWGVFFPVLIGICQSRGWLHISDGAGIYATIGNMNTMSVWLSIAIPFCAGAFLTERKIMTKFIHATCLAAAGYVLFVNQTFGAWIAVVGAALIFLIYPLLVRIGKATRGGIAVIPVLLVSAVNIAMIKLPEMHMDTSVMGYSLQTRLSHAADVFRMGAQHPISGWGPGTFIAVYPQYETHHFGFEMMRAHQEYMQLFSEGGLVGIACLAILLFIIWNQLLSGKQALSMPNRVAASSLSAAMISSFSSFPLHEPVPALYIVCAVAIALNNNFEPNRYNEFKAGASDTVRRGSLQIATAFVIFIAWIVWTSAPLASEIYIKQGHQHVSEKDFGRARNAFLSATRCNPSNGYANFLTGTMMLQQGDTEKALFYARKAGKTRDFGSLHYLLSYIYSRMGEDNLSAYEMVLARDRGFLPLKVSFNQPAQ